jgi:hypothetical protein
MESPLDNRFYRFSLSTSGEGGQARMREIRERIQP